MAMQTAKLSHTQTHTQLYVLFAVLSVAVAILFKYRMQAKFSRGVGWAKQDPDNEMWFLQLQFLVYSFNSMSSMRFSSSKSSNVVHLQVFSFCPTDRPTDRPYVSPSPRPQLVRFYRLLHLSQPIVLDTDSTHRICRSKDPTGGLPGEFCPFARCFSGFSF